MAEMKFVEMLRNKEKIEPKYTLTVEQLMEIDEYHKQGKEHPLESKYPSLTELRAQLNKYGREAEEYLMYHNFPKYMELRAKMILEEELIALQERITKFKDERTAAFRFPKNLTFQERVTTARMYWSETEHLIFSELIVPFAMDDDC